MGDFQLNFDEDQARTLKKLLDGYTVSPAESRELMPLLLDLENQLGEE